MPETPNSGSNLESISPPMENEYVKGKHDNNKAYNIIKLVVIVSCVVLFVLNSYAIFLDFLSNPTIITTHVEKSPDNSLQFPLILICNEVPFKEPNMQTEIEKYRNNTMALSDFLLDMKLVKDAAKNVLGVKPKSIKENLVEIFTAYLGTCFLVQEKLKVGLICIFETSSNHSIF